MAGSHLLLSALSLSGVEKVGKVQGLVVMSVVSGLHKASEHRARAGNQV